IGVAQQRGQPDVAQRAQGQGCGEVPARPADLVPSIASNREMRAVSLPGAKRTKSNRGSAVRAQDRCAPRNASGPCRTNSAFGEDVHYIASSKASTRCGVTGNDVTAPGTPLASSIADAIVAPTAQTP